MDMNAQAAEPTSSRLHTALDPVCGKSVVIGDGALAGDYAGVTYYFTSQACLDRFNQDADIFTLGRPSGTLATHDRGLRTGEAHAFAGRTLFEVTSVGAGPG